MNTISLKRNVEGEFGPQYWTVSGGDFDSMLDAVKSLPFRKWQGNSDKAWLVRFDGIKALREAGYIVTRNADVRVELRRGSESVERLESGSNVEIVLNYRTFATDREEFAIFPTMTPKFTTTLHFDFDPAEIAKLADEERADEITKKHISEKYMDKFCHDSAIYRLTIHALRELDKKANACYKEHIGKRSKDEYKSAIQATWDFVQGSRFPDPTPEDDKPSQENNESPKQDIERQEFSAREAANFLSISMQKLGRLRRSCQIQAECINCRVYRYNRSDLVSLQSSLVAAKAA